MAMLAWLAVWVIGLMAVWVMLCMTLPSAF